MVKRLRVMEKKLTNSGPFRESVDKHSIYAIKKVMHRVWEYFHARLAFTMAALVVFQKWR